VGSGTREVAIRYDDGIRLLLHCVTADEFAVSWFRATGSESHVAEVSARAALRGLTLEARHLRRADGSAVELADEPALYAAIGLPWLPPELREGLGESEAALDGTMPLAPSFDTLGWFARDAATMRRVGPVLLGAPPPQAKPAGLLYAEDLFERADPAVAAALAPAVARVERVLGPRRTVAVAPGTAAGGLDAWFQAIRPLQGHEIWQAHGEWVGRVDPSFGPGVAERFQWVRTIGRDEVAAAQAVRAQVRRHLAELLAGGLILCLPTSPAPAPLKGLPLPETERFRARAIQFTCIAGLAGLPQISLPLARAATPEGSAPVGLSLIAAAGGDETLLDLAEKIAAA